MLKLVITLFFSTLTLLANPCTLDLTPNTADILCEDESLNLSIAYDQGTHAKGKLTKISDASGSTSFTYDAKGNIASKTQTINGTAFTTSYTYNEQDKLKTQTYPSGKVLTYDYNAQGELNSISIDGTPFITDIQTNQNGLVSYTYTDGTTHTRAYDTNGRVTKLIYPDYTETVNYNEVSNITSITADESTKQFDYDLVDRLIKYDHNVTDYQRFTYDANGNRLTQNQEVNKSQSYLYTENTNTLEQIIHTLRVDENTTQTEKEIHYTYDKTGNIINDGTHTYTYDGRNRLTKVDDNISYQYNYDNQRVSKTVGDTITYYIYEAHKLIGEYDQEGNIVKEYVYYNDTPIAITTNTDTHKIYADHLDTPRRVTDNTNTIVWSWESKPFGEDKPTGSYTLNLRFSGQYFDAETKTHYNINRDYNPITGRYIQSDPIGFDGGSNTFLYANGNSVRFVDESGLYSFNRLKNAYQSRSQAFSGRKRSDYDAPYEYDLVWASSGGSCAYRLSNAFNRAGYANIMQSAWKYTKYRTMAYKPTGERYIYSSFEMAEYLGVFSSANKVNNASDMNNKVGIVYFHDSKGGHIDLLETREGFWSDYLYMIGNGEMVDTYMSEHSSTYFMEIEN